MKSIGAFEAKTHLPELLRRAEAGETIVVTRRGQPVAQITPFSQPVSMTPREAMRRLRSLRLNIDRDEIRALRDEGRRS